MAYVIESFTAFRRDDTEALVKLLAGNDWPFHSLGRPDRTTARQWIADGRFDSAFWVGEGDGILRVDDLGDDNPMFDLRLREGARGRGLGTAAVSWLVGHIFGSFATVRRIEATTRQDNVAMRRVLDRCGFAKEAHYRDAWPAPDGSRYDSVGYAVLRSDWSSGTVTPVDWAG